MSNYNKGKKFSGGRGGKKFGGSRDRNRGFGGGKDRGRPEMHKVICDDCGNDCEVPFRPTGDKPVFCNDCFRNKRNNDSRNYRDRGNRSSQSRFDDKQSYQNDGHKNTNNYKTEFEDINAKLDKILGALIPDVSKEKKETPTPKTKKIDKKPKAKKAKIKKPVAKNKKK